MPRVPMEFNARFHDVVDIWLVAEKMGSAIVTCRDHRAAIQKLHRLNYCRKTARGAEDFHTWDWFVARAVGAEVIIEQRAPADLNTIRTADGRTPTLEDIRGVRSQADVAADITAAHIGFAKWQATQAPALDPTQPLVETARRSERNSK